MEVEICKADNCNKPVFNKKNKLCKSHYERFCRTGFTDYNLQVNVNNDVNHYLYKTWQSLKIRCYNPNDRHYKWYGAKGIKVCERWSGYNGFKNFLEDMGDRPKGYSLDRIDCDKDYSPENCRWANIFMQNRNRKSYNTEFPGIQKRKNGSFRATLTVKGERVFDKTYKTFAEAKENLIKIRLKYEECV